jgi:hypothetical protein
MTNFQLLAYPSNSTGAGLLTIASNGTSNENALYQSQDNSLSWSYVSSSYESLQWGWELNLWFSYNPGLQYSTDLRSWTQIYITAPYDTPIVQFLGYWPGNQQDSAVVGTGYQTDGGQYGFEFLFCNQILSGDCEIVEQTTRGFVSLGDSVLVLATGSYINSTSFHSFTPLPSSGKRFCCPLAIKRPHNNQRSSSTMECFSTGRLPAFCARVLHSLILPGTSSSTILLSLLPSICSLI